MLNKAIEKIKSEVENNKKQYIKLIGDFIIDHLTKNPSDAEKVLNEDKTLVKAFNKVREAASKVQVNGCGIVSDADGFKIVLEYYEISGEPTNFNPLQDKDNQVSEQKDNVIKLHNKRFDADLDDLLD